MANTRNVMMRMLSVRRVGVVVFVITFMTLLYDGLLRVDPPKDDSHVVLLWTPIFGDWHWYPQGAQDTPFNNKLCHYDDCYITTDRSLLSRAEAVLFHCKDPVDHWPRVRTPHQLYVTACQESPTSADFSQYGDMINITATYRRDSDIFFPNCWFSPLAKRLETYKPPVPVQERTYSIAWPVSNCAAPSHRTQYATQLGQHIDLHVYGDCGKYHCPRDKLDGCMRHFARNYKFYASFENTVCCDYITEKFFLPLQYDLVPIVLGGADYSIFPKNSYIDVRDYPSPKVLADHLKYLAENETAYNEYLSWRREYSLHCDNKEKLFCDLCQTLRDGRYKKQYPDVNTWWSRDMCDNSKIPALLQSNL